MIDLTVVIPVEKWNEEERKYLDRALKSLFKQKVKPVEIILGFNKELKDDKNFIGFIDEKTKEFETVNINITKSYSDSYIFEHCPHNSVTAIAGCVKLVKTKYFTVLEATDEFEISWFENVEKYIETSDKEISIYFPICKVFNQEGEFVRFLNEQWWANGFSKDLDLGYIDEEGLKLMYDMNLSGAVINKSDYDAIGGLKTNIKLYYWYEFLLRLIYNHKNAFIIPKSLYNHVYFPAINIETDEAKFYWDSVQTEYYFIDQRDLKFEENKAKAVTNGEN
jgi:hypothetical protein